MLIFRKATLSDIDAVTAIYDAIHTLEESGDIVIGWQRGVYPVRATSENALRAGHLYVAELDGIVVASARINNDQEEAYRSIPWHIPADDDHVLVMHTLTVDPAFAGRGIGPAFAEFYEDLARAAGCTALRIDTNERNARARKLYARLGYREAGVIPTVFNGIAGVDLVCLEKQVTPKGGTNA